MRGLVFGSGVAFVMLLMAVEIKFYTFTGFGLKQRLNSAVGREKKMNRREKCAGNRGDRKLFAPLPDERKTKVMG